MPHMANGTFKAACTEHAWAKSKGGKEQLCLSFRLDEGPNQGETILAYLYFTEGALPHSLKSLRALGWAGNNLENLGALSAPVRIVLLDEEWEGKSHTKVKWINALGTGVSQIQSAMSADEVRLFAARLQGRIDSLSGPGDDIIPF
jgi:hypothetical protein